MTGTPPTHEEVDKIATAIGEMQQAVASLLTTLKLVAGSIDNIIRTVELHRQRLADLESGEGPA